MSLRSVVIHKIRANMNPQGVSKPGKCLILPNTADNNHLLRNLSHRLMWFHLTSLLINEAKKSSSNSRVKLNKKGSNFSSKLYLKPEIFHIRPRSLSKSSNNPKLKSHTSSKRWRFPLYHEVSQGELLSKNLLIRRNNNRRLKKNMKCKNK